jgi:uncharacterized membrane protein YidH (DUF202 family)
VLIIAGTVMVVLAAVRFVHTRRAIDNPNPRTDAVGADLALAAMMTALGLALVPYLVHTLLTVNAPCRSDHPDAAHFVVEEHRLV